MSTRAFILAVTGCAVIVACGSYGTSVVVGNTRAAVASVSLAVPPSLAAGQTARAIATPKGADGTALTDRPIIWYTSSTSVASVSDSGVISAVAPGTTVVSAVSEGVAGQATMAVVPPPPTPIATLEVSVDPSAVLIGQTAKATATLADSSGNPISGRTITWESSNTSVATVDTTGTVKAVGSGQSMIKASSTGKTNSSRLDVSAPAPIPVASVSVSPASASLQVGASVQLSAVTSDANNNVLTGRVIGWSSSNNGIATVSSSGLVTAIAGGSVSITAASEGQTGSAAIAVSAPAPIPVATVSVSPSTSTLQVGGTVQLSAVTRDANNNVLTGRSITWSSSNTGISTVSASGLVTAIAAGTATITALSETKNGTAAITVSAPAPVPVATVSVSPASSTLQIGGTVQLSGVTRDASNNILTGRSITWSSSNNGISTVSASGLVTAIAAGSVIITALSETKNGTAVVVVSAPPVPVASVSVSPAADTLQVGSTGQFSAVTRDANNNILTGRAITWSSSNTAIATVSPSGLATAVASGNAQIRATSETKIDSATLTVTAPPPPPPPGSGPVWRGNEPTGMTSINERGFNSLAETAWGTMSGPGATIVADATAPQSPSSTLHFNYPAGFAGGGAPESSSMSIADYRVVYLSYWVKYSANWQGHLTAINKQGYVWFANTPGFVIESEGIGSSQLHSRMAIQYAVRQPNSSGWYPQNLVPSAVFTRGQWDYVEIVLTGNSSGAADGALEWWLNGVKVGSYTGIQWASSAALWNYVRIDPVWGGIGDVVSSSQYMALDHYYVSGKR